MKILTSSIEKMFTSYALIAINLVIILLAEFTGGGTFFATTGIIHSITIVFLALIILRIFTDYNFTDEILKGFLMIQIGFFLLLGFLHLYEFLGVHVFNISDDVVELSVMMSYLFWLIGTVLSIDFVFNRYNDKGSIFTWILVFLTTGMALLIFYFNLLGVSLDFFPTWFLEAILGAVLFFAAVVIFYLIKLGKIVPIFMQYSYYAVPAVAFVAFAVLFEYFETNNFLSSIGISSVQNLYISHFFVYAAISLLLVGFSKLKNPVGIYGEM